MSLVLRRFGIPCVPHSMRSSFRDWCSEMGVRREVAEAALAHVVKNKVEAAYARSDLLESSREVMERWSDYLAMGHRAAQASLDSAITSRITASVGPVRCVAAADH